MAQQKFGIALPIILFSYFLILMDNSIIFTSTVKIAQDLHMNAVTLSWVSNAYTITFGGFLLLAGRLGDLLGRKKIFLFGLLLFGLSSLAIGLSQTDTQMILFRAIQGIGSAIIAPTSLAILMDQYAGPMRSKAISYYGATAGIGASVGLLLGGFLTSTFSWRTGFLINVPFTLILFIMTMKGIQQTNIKRLRIDYLGALLSVVLSLLFVYGITAHNILMIIISMIMLIIFIIYQSKISYALMPLSLFNNKIRSGAYIARFTFMMAMLSYWFIIPQMMQHIYHFSPLQAGMGFLSLTIVNFIAALYLPKLMERIDNGRVMILGQIILLLGLIISALLDPTQGYWITIGLPMILVGLGQGWLLAPLTSAGVHDVDQNIAGAASGVTNTMHQLGGPVGLSIIVALTSAITPITAYYHTVMWLIVVFMIIGLIAIVVTQRNYEN
ncbi:MFS transporter [Macrococcoides canis]|uniref:MFS transporter n=1 Tax=Macrococcoides canis TaxID=1855823 RepID=UPI00220FA2F1|nr:MFS transporter [Macrococcus canis]UTH11868.1 MFS transporter [Macrococcus canis]